MIRINKPARIPRMLTDKGRGVYQTQMDCDEFDTCPDKFLSGALTMSDKISEIYGSSGVKSALVKAHHEKCCYCERRRERTEIDVEHFRPKGAVKQSKGAQKLSPGYYWLAYNWDNLYLACKSCNTKWKGILFPLANEARRARWHGDANLVENEEPLFIDPGFEDPSDHLRFYRDIPAPTTRKGRITIQDLGLTGEERPLLKEARLEKINVLEMYCKVVEAALKRPDVAELAELSHQAKGQLCGMVKPSAEFSLMSKNFIEDYFAERGYPPADFLE